MTGFELGDEIFFDSEVNINIETENSESVSEDTYTVEETLGEIAEYTEGVVAAISDNIVNTVSDVLADLFGDSIAEMM